MKGTIHGEDSPLSARMAEAVSFAECGGNTSLLFLKAKLGYRLAGKTMFHFMGFVWEELNCYERVL